MEVNKFVCSEDELAQKRELYEERAGILEFDAHFSRTEAEERAWMEVYGRKPSRQANLWSETT